MFKFESSLDLCFHYFCFCAGFVQSIAMKIEKNVMRANGAHRSGRWDDNIFEDKMKIFRIYLFIFLFALAVAL